MTGLLTRLKRTEDPAARVALLRTAALGHRLLRGHRVRARRVARYLAVTAEPKLQIGSGPHALEGWLNTDLIRSDVHVDLARPLPFADATFAYAFGEHIIEHLPDTQAEALLAELRRVLRPGGVLRLVTPDLRALVAIYEDRNDLVSREEYARHLDGVSGRSHLRAAQVLNDALRLWGHRWIYDEEDLRARLEQAGFGDIVRCVPGESRHAALRGVERHGDTAWANRADAVVLEAVT